MNKKYVGIAAAAGIAAVVIAIIFLYTPQTTTQVHTSSHNPSLGLVIMPPTQATKLKDIQDAYSEAADTGIGRSNVYLSWPNVEPKEGSYNWSTSDILMGLNREQNLNVTLYFSVINNRVLGPFPDWMGTPTFDQKFQDQTVAALDALLSRYYIVDYVIIGGNIDSYFKDHPDQIPSYVDYFNGVYSKIKEKHPNVKMGNWFSLNDVANHYEGDVVSKLNQGDFVAYSYAPVDLLYYQNESPDAKASNLQKMIDYAKGKKIALMEIGWSTSSSVNGTVNDQVKFVQDVFDFYKKNKSDFEFLTWYRQYDRPFDTCYSPLNKDASSMFGNENVLNNTASYLCGSGLFDVDKNPKPAWDEFKKQIRLNLNS